MNRNTAAAVIGLSLFTGCASAPPPEPVTAHADPADHADDTLAFHVGGRSQVSAVVTPEGIHGMTMRLDRLGNGPGFLSGFAGRAPVELTIGPGAVQGWIGASRLQIEVARDDDDTLHVTGLIHGRASDFRVGAGGLRGTIGACGYDLDWTGEDFEGKRDCGPRLEPASLTLPAPLSSWDDADLGASLGILLGEDDPGVIFVPCPPAVQPVVYVGMPAGRPLVPGKPATPKAGTQNTPVVHGHPQGSGSGTPNSGSHGGGKGGGTGHK